jgi:hypothetical protein
LSGDRIWSPSFFENTTNGVLSTNFEVGTFLTIQKWSRLLFFSSQLFYKINGTWKIRQFIKPQVIIGSNRQNSIGDRLTINEKYGIQGFNSAYMETKNHNDSTDSRICTKRYLGFRMNPYLNYSIALLGSNVDGIKQIKLENRYWSIINNDYLVFSSFQLSLSYYPTIPFQGNNIFSTNAFETSDFGLQNFELAKPRTIQYK